MDDLTDDKKSVIWNYAKLLVSYYFDVSEGKDRLAVLYGTRLNRSPVRYFVTATDIASS